MASFPSSPKAYPATPKAYPAAPKAYPASPNAFPVGGAALNASQSFGVEIVASLLQPLVASQGFVVDIDADTSSGLTAAVVYMKRGNNLTLGTTMRAIGGTSPPVVTLAAGSGSLTFATGCPGFWVDILPGALTFDLSFDNGSTVTFAAQTIPVGGGNYTIPSGTFAGMLIGFPLGTYDAATVYHGTIATWASFSGSGSYTFTNATVAAQPIYEVAGLDSEPCLRYGTGTVEGLDSSDAAICTALTDHPLFELMYKVKFDLQDPTATGTVFSVGNSASNANSKRRFGQNNTGAGRSTHVWGTAAGATGSNESVTVSANPDLYDWFTPTAGAGITITLLVDGAATSIAASAANTGTLTANRASIGRTVDLTPDSPCAGRIGSVVLFDHELAGADRTAWAAEIENAP